MMWSGLADRLRADQRRRACCSVLLCSSLALLSCVGTVPGGGERPRGASSSASGWCSGGEAYCAETMDPFATGWRNGPTVTWGPYPIIGDGYVWRFTASADWITNTVFQQYSNPPIERSTEFQSFKVSDKIEVTVEYRMVGAPVNAQFYPALQIYECADGRRFEWVLPLNREMVVPDDADWHSRTFEFELGEDYVNCAIRSGSIITGLEINGLNPTLGVRRVKINSQGAVPHYFGRGSTCRPEEIGTTQCHGGQVIECQATSLFRSCAQWVDQCGDNPAVCSDDWPNCGQGCAPVERCEFPVVLDQQWVSIEDCAGDTPHCVVRPDGATCSSDECSSSSFCSSELLGDMRCAEHTPETCVEDSVGCLVWEGGQTCRAPQICLQESQDRAICADCQSNCDRAGARRCAADLSGTESCEEVRSGCLRWADDSFCALPKLCLETLGNPGCAEPVPLPSHCSEDITCSRAGDTRCNGNNLETCRDKGNGCLLWQGDDCGSRGKFCVEAGVTASCEAACSSNCTAAGTRRCFGSADAKKLIQTCTEMTDSIGNSCKMWLTTDACGEETPFCTDAPQARCYTNDVFLPLVMKNYRFVDGGVSSPTAFSGSFVIQNLSESDPAIAVVEYFKRDGSGGKGAYAQTITIPSRESGQSPSRKIDMDLTHAAVLEEIIAPAGGIQTASSFEGSVIIRANRPVAAVVNETAGVKNPFGAAAYSACSPADLSEEIYAPLITRIGEPDTVINIQNPTGQQVDVEIEYTVGVYGTNHTQTISLDPYGSKSIAVPEDALDGSSRFLGSATIRSKLAGVELAAVVDELYATNPASKPRHNARQSYKGFAGGSSSIVAPLIQKNDNGVWYTGLQVMNIGPGPATVSITYAGLRGTGGGRSCKPVTDVSGLAEPKFTLEVGGSKTILTEFGGALDSEALAKVDCFRGAATAKVVSGTGKLAGIVSVAGEGIPQLSVYRAFDADAQRATTRIAVPLIEKYLEGGSAIATGWSTGTQVANLGLMTAKVDATFYVACDSGFAKVTDSALVGPKASVTFLQLNDFDHGSLEERTNCIGSAVFEADQPIVGILQQSFFGESNPFVGDVLLACEAFNF